MSALMHVPVLFIISESGFRRWAICKPLEPIPKAFKLGLLEDLFNSMIMKSSKIGYWKIHSNVLGIFCK